MGMDSCTHKTGSTPFTVWQVFCSTPRINWMDQSAPAVSGMFPTAFVLNNGNAKNQPGRCSATGRYCSLSCETKAGPINQRTLASPVGSPSRVKRLYGLPGRHGPP